jgi:hypothetical protein
LVDGDKQITLNELFRTKFKTDASQACFDLNNEHFDLLHVKIEERSFPANKLYLCANNRLVESVDLDKIIVDLDSHFFDENSFLYIGVLTSPYFDRNVEMARLSFNIPEKHSEETLFEGTSLEDIVGKACEFIEVYLAEFLAPISAQKEIQISEFIDTQAPQYKHLIKYMPESVKKIKPHLTQEKLDEALYSLKKDFERQTKADQKTLIELLDNPDLNAQEYEERFREKVARITASNSSALADYVTHRRVIIDLLDKALHRQEDGKFNKEKYLHSLIYPMGHDSDDCSYEAHSLWLIDERLSYCRYISSDIPFGNNRSEGRPDMLMLDKAIAVSDDDESAVYDTIVLFEFKRPGRDDYTRQKNPIDQLIDYLAKIQNGKAKDRHFREIKVNQSTQYYLYAVCDVTASLKTILEIRDFKPTPDSLGYFCYISNLNAYIEILSYDKILTDAKKRNRILFDKLGIMQ